MKCKVNLRRDTISELREGTDQKRSSSPNTSSVSCVLVFKLCKIQQDDGPEEFKVIIVGDSVAGLWN